MKVYKCDGTRYSDGVQCTSETTNEDEKGFPSSWLTISGKIINNNRDHHTIESNGLHHFCCWECLYLFLFKNVEKIDAQ